MPLPSNLPQKKKIKLREERECACPPPPPSDRNAFHLEPIRCLESGCVLYYVGMQADVSELVARGGTACVAAVEHEEEARAAQVGSQGQRWRASSLFAFWWAAA